MHNAQRTIHNCVEWATELVKSNRVDWMCCVGCVKLSRIRSHFEGKIQNLEQIAKEQIRRGQRLLAQGKPTIRKVERRKHGILDFKLNELTKHL